MFVEESDELRAERLDFVPESELHSGQYIKYLTSVAPRTMTMGMLSGLTHTGATPHRLQRSTRRGDLCVDPRIWLKPTPHSGLRRPAPNATYLGHS